DGVGGVAPTANNALVGTATCPACAMPNSLTTLNIGDVSVDLSWVESGSATDWDIEWGPAGFTQGFGTTISGVTSNPYNLSGLSASTSYDFYVRSDCGGSGTSNWAGPYNFVTASCAAIDQCWYVLYMNDLGNSWNGANIEVVQDGVSLGTFTVPGGGTNTDSVLLCEGSTIELIWTSGTYDNETYFDMQDNFGTSVFSWPSGGAPSAGLFHTFTAICSPPTCPAPVNPGATNIMSTTTDLFWTETGSATTWNIEYGPAGFTQGTGTIITGVTANPYQLTGLSSSTSYSFYVQADCGGGDYSFWTGPYTFTTTCNVIAAPYFQNFENGGSIPVCWINATGDDFNWSFGLTTPTANTGPQNGDHTSGTGYFAYTESSNPNYPANQADLLTPIIDISTLTNPSLTFWYNLYGANMGTLHVDIYDGTWHNDIFIISGNQGDVWTEVVLNLAAYTSPVQARFRGVTGTDWTSDMAVDDVRFDELPTCPQPSGLTAQNVQSDQADLGWTENGFATTWEIEYGPFGFTQGTGTTITGINSNPYTLTGLSPVTNYSFYVRSDCGGGDYSYWVGPLSFMTACAPYTAPYTENFENGGLIPLCWTNETGDDFNWSFGTATPSPNTGPQSGDHTSGSGYFAYTEASTPNNPYLEAYLLSPEIDITPLTVPALTFYHHLFGVNMGELHVDVFDGSWHNDIYITSGDQGDIWTMVLLSLNGYNSPVQLRFRGITGDGYASDMAVDDVIIDEMPTCPQPNSLAANGITENSANLSWNEIGTATTWNIEYGPAGFILGTGTLISGVTNNPYNLSGLAGGTGYAFYVQSDCGGGDLSSWSGPFLFTTATPPVSNPSSCGLAIAIPDNDCVDIYIDVTGIPGMQLGTDVILKDVNIIATHVFDQDLLISLESPNGVEVDLTTQNGGGGDNYGMPDTICDQFTNFNMTGTDGPVTGGTAPFIGSYIPEGDFTDFDDGSNPNAYWIIHVCDNMNGDVGEFHFVELVFEQILQPADIIINELDCDQTGTDTLEFVELFDGGVGNYPLYGYSVVFYNGSTDQCYASFGLDGYFTDPQGYFVLGNAGLPGVDLVFADNLLQNGADAVALFQDDVSAFPVGCAISLTNLKDALVYETNDPIDVQLLALLNMGQPQIDEDYLSNKDIHSCSRIPNGSGGQRNTYTYTATVPTPDAENRSLPELVWNGMVFTEALVNDGSIGNNISLQLNGNIFYAVGTMTETVHYTVANVPAGLTVEVNVLTDTTAEISLTGNALSHLNVDDIGNLTIVFTDAAYGDLPSVYVSGNGQTAITVDFFDAPPPTMTWDMTTFNEAVANDGSVTDILTLALYSETFVVSAGTMTENTHFTTANVPTGLTVEITATGPATAEIALTGNALNHADADDVSDMEIAFLDDAFTGGTAANVSGFEMTGIIIDFMDPQFTDLAVINDTISYGCDYTNAESIEICMLNSGTFLIPAGDTIYVFLEFPPGNVPIAESFMLAADLDIGDTVCYTFSQTLDFSTLGTYNHLLYVQYDADEEGFNDSVYTAAEHYAFDVNLGGVNDTIWVISYPYTLDGGTCPFSLICSYMWSDASSGQSLDVGSDGWYGLTVTDENNCQDEDSVYVALQTYVQITGTNSFLVYPNPSDGSFLIDIENAEGELVLRIFDSFGRLIFNEEFSAYGHIIHPVKLTDYPAGIYMLRINDDNSELFKKIIIY
ncbi:MAG: fibronectin type III domain-containing protein, partial [Bacteroidota bacterium]